MILKNKKLYYRKDGTTYSVRLMTPNDADNIRSITQGGLRKGINVAYGGKTWCSLCKLGENSGFNFYKDVHYTVVDQDPKVRIIFQRWTKFDTEYIKITDIYLYYSSIEPFIFFLSNIDGSTDIGTWLGEISSSTFGGLEYYHIIPDSMLNNNTGNFYFSMMNKRTNVTLLHRVPINDAFNITPETMSTFVKDISLADYEDLFTISV